MGSNFREHSMYNPNSDKSVKEINMRSLDEVKYEFRKMLSHYRQYPDHFIDAIRTENTRFRLTPFQRVFLRSFFRYKKVGIVASRGISKCVTGDTLISTNKGLVKIGDIANWKKEESEDFIDNYVMNINGEIEYSDIVVSNGLKDTKKITTVDGYELEGTHVHPILTIDKNGDMKFKTLSELNVGDYVAINRKGVFGNTTELNFDMDSYVDGLNNHQYMIKHIDVPKYLTEDFAYYLGLLQGDGCLTTKNCYMFTSEDNELINFFKEFTSKTFGKDVYYVGQYDYRVNSVYVREYLRQLGFDFSKANEKTIPKCIMSAPKNIVAKFLRGLFDTDGTVNDISVSITTSSEEMSKQIQQLLLNFGIVSHRKKRFDKKYETYSYQVYMCSINVDIFNQEIGFGLKRKQDRLNSNCDVKRNPNKNIIPYQKDRVSRIIKHSNMNYKQKDKFKHILSGGNQLSYDKLKQLLENVDSVDADYAILLGMFEDNFYWDKIESIEDGRNYVYDFHVPISHTFIGNGFVNHNTYIDVMAHYLKCIMYPNNHICLAMPTKTQSAKVVEEKVEELWTDYPLLKNELIIEKCKFQKDYVKLVFRNGSTLDTLTVGESSRGLRGNGIVLEELVDEKMDRDTINNVILPILAQPRMTRHGADPNEYSKTQGYITTASHKQSYCYEKYMELFGEMINGEPTIVLGTSYEMGVRFGTLDLDDVNEKLNSPTYSPLSFDREYRSIFTGSSEKSLVSLEDINKCRTITVAEHRADKKNKDAIYVLSYDIARAEGKQTANSSLAVFKCIPRGDGTYQKFLVNMFTNEGTHFYEQAIFLKQKVVEFNASVLCLDHNGLGSAVTDILVTEIDGNPPYSVINDDRYDKYKRSNSIPMLFLISANTKETKNTDIVNIFMSIIANKDVNILKSETNMRSVIKDADPTKLSQKLLPYVQVDRMVDEIMNLEYVQSGNSTSVKQISKSVQKDRYSAFSYGLYYIYLLEKENNKRKREVFDATGFFAFKKPKTKINGWD